MGAMKTRRLRRSSLPPGATTRSFEFVHVRIHYCELCRYEERARALAAELAERFGATTEVIEGKFGQFDVEVDGALVASRGQSFFARMLPRDAPGSSDVIAAIEHHVAPREGESCERPPR